MASEGSEGCLGAEGPSGGSGGGIWLAGESEEGKYRSCRLRALGREPVERLRLLCLKAGNVKVALGQVKSGLYVCACTHAWHDAHTWWLMSGLV